MLIFLSGKRYCKFVSMDNRETNNRSEILENLHFEMCKIWLIFSYKELSSNEIIYVTLVFSLID